MLAEQDRMKKKKDLDGMGDRKNFLTSAAILRYFKASTVDGQPELLLRVVDRLRNRKYFSNLGPSVRV
jgi:hypothetical protein